MDSRLLHYRRRQSYSRPPTPRRREAAGERLPPKIPGWRGIAPASRALAASPAACRISFSTRRVLRRTRCLSTGIRPLRVQHRTRPSRAIRGECGRRRTCACARWLCARLRGPPTTTRVSPGRRAEAPVRARLARRVAAWPAVPCVNVRAAPGLSALALAESEAPRAIRGATPLPPQPGPAACPQHGRGSSSRSPWRCPGVP